MSLWAHVWRDWGLVSALSWLLLELGSIAYAHVTGARHLTAYTLSDTIRRWSSRYRWLAPVTVGLVAFLMTHFFGVSNP